MAALPSPTQVAGNNSAIYEAYYNVVDPNGFGTVGGLEAARFLKKSGLSDVILSKIWDMSDPGGRGCLDKSGMFVALKLVALVQNGKDLNITNVNVEVPPPKMGDVPIPKPTKPPPPVSSNTPLITSLPPSAVDWTVKPAEREKYDKLFESLQPSNGLIPGNKVKNVLMESKLPFETLGKIWDLADQDQDGMLNRHEFVVAMHLVYKALEKYAIPNQLPPELMPTYTKRKTPSPLGAGGIIPGVTTAPILNRGLDGIKPELPPVPPTIITPKWTVTPEEKSKSDTLFIKSDIDKDGFVSGHEIKDIFLQSGVPQPVLAHIWALCDIKQTGKLNNEQFALAMWFIARCLKGVEPPPALTPEMVPPSFRAGGQANAVGAAKPDGLVENNNTRYSNPELDMISKDIEELAREKLALETDIAQKEADIKIKSGEIKSLQSELDTLAATLKQLENQKGEAQKRLNDLKAQVDKLRVQAAEQAELVASQESELNSKKEQLEGLRLEEQRLEQLKQDNLNKLQNLSTNLQDTQLNISQTKALITQLQEQTRQMTDAITSCETAIEAGDATVVPDTVLKINPDFRDPEYRKIGLFNGNGNKQNGFGEDPFNSRNGFTNKTNVGDFGDDPFKNDPFKNDSAFSSDPFASAAFSKPNNGFSSDPFGQGAFDAKPTPDPFNNAFGDPQGATDAQPSETSEDKDPFGCDPFAVLHAPTRESTTPQLQRSSSPSPALPPKKSKQPPPRPAPPRPNQPPKRSSQPDLFEDPFEAPSGGFADFADFDAKFSDKTNTPSSTKAQFATTKRGLDFTDDPFRDYRYEYPTNITFDEEEEEGGVGAKPPDKFDPFGLDNSSGRQSVPPLGGLSVGGGFSSSGRASAPIVGKQLNEELQLAWAAKDSLRLEEDRKKRLLQQEQADLELAISLSKAENKKL